MENKGIFNVKVVGLIEAKMDECAKVMEKDVKYMTEGFDLFFKKEAHELYVYAALNRKLTGLKEALTQMYSLEGRDTLDFAEEVEAHNKCAEMITAEMNFHENILLNGEVMSCTTNLLYNIAYLYDREVYQRYLKILRLLLNRLKDMGGVN